MTGVLIRRDIDTEIHRGKALCDDRGIYWNDASTVKECQGLSATTGSEGKGMKQTLPQSPRKRIQPWPHPDCRLLASRPARE